MKRSHVHELWKSDAPRGSVLPSAAPPHLNEAVMGSVVEGDLTIAGVHHGEALPDPIGRQVVEVPHLTPLQFSPIHGDITIVYATVQGHHGAGVASRA